MAGDVVTLEGSLGSGKTTLAKGIARGLAVRSEAEVTSPTFTLIHEYEGREKIYHIDWYRLRAVRGADARLAEECFASKAVTLVEWPERGRRVLPSERIEIRLRHAGERARHIKITAKGLQYKDFLDEAARF